MSDLMIELIEVIGLCCFLVILSVIELLFKKRDRKVDSFAELDRVLPDMINDCERRNIVGSENKLQYVLDLACAYLAPRLKLAVQDVHLKYDSLIAMKVEKVLTTPQKKKEVPHA